MKYIIVTAKSVGALQELVVEYITEGYRPTGGVAVAMDQGYQEYCQAMVKG